MQCNENLIYVSQEKELRGLSPNFHIHVSVSYWYIPSEIGRLILGIQYINRSQTHECENGDWGRPIPFLGIFVSNFRYCVFAVWGSVLKRFQQGNISLLASCSIKAISSKGFHVTLYVFWERICSPKTVPLESYCFPEPVPLVGIIAVLTRDLLSSGKVAEWLKFCCSPPVERTKI